MGRDNDDETIPEDGGWGDMVDHGNDLGEYLLGTTHPYDLHGHKPADRWGTRQQLVSEPFADPGSLLDEGKQPQGRLIQSSGRGRLPRKPPTSRNKAPAQVNQPRTQAVRSLGATKKLNCDPFNDDVLQGSAKGRLKAARTRSAGYTLRMAPDDVWAIVTCGLPTKEIAQRTGLSKKQIQEVREAYASAVKTIKRAPSVRPGTETKRPAVTAAQKQQKIRSKTGPVTEPRKRVKMFEASVEAQIIQRPMLVPKIQCCASCGAPIGPNGRCLCS